VSDQLDALAAPGFEQETLAEISGWLYETRADWDACIFDELGPGAVLRGVESSHAKRIVFEPQSVRPVLVAPCRAALEDVVPCGQAAKLRKARRRVERIGTVEFVRADRGDFGGALQSLFNLHTKRWGSLRQPGVLDDPRIRDLHREMAAVFAARGALRLYVLRLAGRCAAVVYGFRERGRVHLYLQGFDPELERASPGTLIVGAIIEDALAEGVSEIDFLRGAERYKYDWGATDETNDRLTLFA
jgi:CelD/BcsL family acetyltransferase involved in cellulose biosynthesis